MQKFGAIALVVGLLVVIGALARTAYTMVTAFTAAQTDPFAGAPAVSLATPLNWVVVGVVLVLAGVVLLIASRR